MVGTVIDIETTGLKWDSDQITEVAAIRIDTETNKILKADNFYFYKPEWDVDKASQWNGITRSFLEKVYRETESPIEGLTLFEANMNKLISFVTNTAIIGKNSNNFDIPFIYSFINRQASINIASFGSSKHIDVQETFSDKWREMAGVKHTRKLGKLEQYIEVIPNGEALAKQVFSNLKVETGRGTDYHTALYDAVCTYIVYCYDKAPWK